MKQIATDVFHLDRVRIPSAVNAHLVGDVLIDAGRRRHRERSMRALAGLTLPKAFFTPDPERNRQSAQPVVALEPSVVAVGHGPPVADSARFVSFCNGW